MNSKLKKLAKCSMSMDGGGFEPPKQLATDLQSAPFGHSGIHPFSLNGAYRARTYDPLLVRQMLSQLSYDPKIFHLCTIPRDGLSHRIREYLLKCLTSTTQKRLELSTSAVTGRRSNQLSHWALL